MSKLNYGEILHAQTQGNSPQLHPEVWLSPSQLDDNQELVRIASHPTVDVRQRSAALEQLKRNGVTGVPA